MTHLDRRQARAMLQSLRDGQVPSSGASRLCVGREEIINGYRQLLDDVTQGQAAVKFIRGDYGYGKSMLLRVFEEIALEKQFAVAKVSIRSELPFNKLEEFYRKIAREISPERGEPGIAGLLRFWEENVRRDVQKENPDLEPFETNQRISALASKRLREVREASPGFARGAEAYMEAVLENKRHQADVAIAWLRQDQHQRATDKKLIGVKGSISRENAHEYLQGLLRFVWCAGLAGTVVLVDEAEYMRLLPQERLRHIAYDNIRALWDACSEGEVRYALLVFAATEEMFTDPRRGFPAYDALVDRMDTDHMALGGTNDRTPNLDMRWPIVDLPLLHREQVVELGGRLVKLHSQAEAWDGTRCVGGDLLGKIADRAAGALLGDGVRPREFVRAMIRWLDRIQQQPEAPAHTLTQLFGRDLQEAMQEEVEEDEPLWSEP